MSRQPLIVGLLCAAALAACGGNDGPTGVASGLDPSQAARLVELENRGIGLLERYDYTAAVEPLREALALAPRWKEGRIHLALALLNAGEETRAEAGQLLDQVAAEHPDDPYAVFMAGVLAQNAGDTQKAEALFRTAWEATQDPVVGAKLGALLAQGSEAEEAEALTILEEVHRRSPALVAPVNQLMLLYGARDQIDKQTEFLALLRALKGQANPGVGSSTIGRDIQIAYGNLGRYSMARRDFGELGLAAERPGGVVVAGSPVPLGAWSSGDLPEGAPYLGLAVLDVDADGDQDVFVCGGSQPCALLRNDTAGPGEPLTFTDIAQEAGVAVKGVYSVACGEFDVDPTPRDASASGLRRDLDLLLMRGDGVSLFLSRGDGTFENATEASGLAADPGGARAVLVVDADQEGDLDLFLSAGPGQRNRLWANRGPGRFEEVAQSAGVAGDGNAYGPAVVLDADEDYDLDLLVTRPDSAPVLFLNDRMLKFHVGTAPAPAGVIAAHGALCADLDRDGREDALLCSDGGVTLLRGRGDGEFEALALAGAPGGAATLLDTRGAGLLDLVFAQGAWMEAATGSAPFRAPQDLLPAADGALRNTASADLDGDGREEVLLLAPGGPVQAVPVNTVDGLGAGATVVLDFEGVIRNDVQAGWSNLEGRGALVEVKAGRFWQMRRVGNPQGFGAAAPTRMVAGVGTASRADYVRVLWPDAVQHAALDVPVGQVQRIVEEQRRPDSCPLLFSWDGERYAFVTDFIGAGGVGFLVAPGEYGLPDPTESVKVSGAMVRPNAAGELVFKLVEAMEETCYLDQADLLVVDHPADVAVELDERFAGARPFPSGEPIAYRDELLPVAATDRHGEDVLASVLTVDRRYPESKLHPRLLGATEQAVLELDFGPLLAEQQGPLSLCMHGWIEYGYTRTTVAAAGEGFEYVLPVLEAWHPEQESWVTVGADLGYPAGFPRVMSYDLTGKLPTGATRLRIRTNFEIYWDRVWIAPRIDTSVLRTTTVAAKSANLRWLGYPREYSPDGRHPRIYDYHTLDPNMPWKAVEGDYTRFGDVLPLLGAADDMYVVHGKGEEIDLRFDAAALPSRPDGWERTYVLRFTGWCKGQELYTAHGFTVEPLPFLGMSNYPYGPEESYPETEQHRRYRERWNTRRVRGGGSEAAEKATSSGTR